MASNEKSKHPPILLFTYVGSPFRLKVENALAYLQLPHYTCPVSLVANARGFLRDLGIVHRRIPILAIGSEFYFDSNCIIAKLETLAQGRTLQMQEPVAKVAESFVEKELFWNVVSLLPEATLKNKPFMEDRTATFGDAFADPSHFMDAGRRARAKAGLQIQLSTLENYVKDAVESAPFVSKSSEPSVLDISIHVLLTLATSMNRSDYLPSPPFKEGHSSLFPHLSVYLQRVQAAFDEYRAANPPIKQIAQADVAAFLSKSSLPPLPSLADFDDPSGLKVQLGKRVTLWQKDVERGQQTGVLVYIDGLKGAIEVESPNQIQKLRVWVDRSQFNIRPLQGAKI